MRTCIPAILTLPWALVASVLAADFRLAVPPRDGAATLTIVHTNAVCTVETADAVTGPWRAQENVFATAVPVQVQLAPRAPQAFYRARALPLAGPSGFSNLVASYGVLTTVAGAGGSPEAINKWLPESEGGPATEAFLSRPHLAMADAAGNIFIADKDAHAVRKVTSAGRIVTVAGVNRPGNGPDGPTSGPAVPLSEPNGLWVKSDGTAFILDLGNAKIRRLDPTGVLTTLFTVPGGINGGRGLWVDADEALAYVASGTAVKRWTKAGGVTTYATGFVELGNLVVDPGGALVVSDRRGHRVWRVFADGTRVALAGNGTPSTVEPGGGEGGRATLTPLNEVRGVWFVPSSSAFFVCTHRGSQVWYIDPEGLIHLFLNGATSNTHGGDGAWFWAPDEFRISECRALTLAPSGDLLLTEHDSGYIRRVRFLPMDP